MENKDFKERVEYMKMLNSAIFMATAGHDGQVDKAGEPYILHPLRVMQNVIALEAKVVAVLHDVLEDTLFTQEDMRIAGFTPEIIEAVVCLTRKDKENYMDFIRRCKTNKLARTVKLADLADNCNLKRIKNPSIEDFERVGKYEKAMQILIMEDL